MRVLLLCLFVAVLASCQSRTDTTDDLSDTLDVDTTILIPDVDIDTTLAARTELEPLQHALEELIHSREENSGSMYRLQLTASGYEYQTNATWYFDSLFLLSGRSQSWASEGSEGKSEHFFKLDKLYAFRDDTESGSSTSVELFHRDLGGLKYEEGDGVSQDSTMTAVEPEVRSREEADLKGQLKEIIKSLRENQDDIVQEDDGVVLQLKNEARYGEETVTETSEITLDKKLLQRLLE
jgi:hypothetical protein